MVCFESCLDTSQSGAGCRQASLHAARSAGVGVQRIRSCGLVRVADDKVAPVGAVSGSQRKVMV